VDFIVIDMEPR
jgi:hypothetical protein